MMPENTEESHKHHWATTKHLIVTDWYICGACDIPLIEYDRITGYGSVEVKCSYCGEWSQLF